MIEFDVSKYARDYFSDLSTQNLLNENYKKINDFQMF